MIGIVTGRDVKKIRDGDKDRIILKVKMIEEDDDNDSDVRIVELFSQAGEDNNPADDCRVMVLDAVDSYKIGIAVSDDLAPESEAGECEIYSTDNPVTEKKARTKWTKDGDIIHDADGGAKIEMDHGGDLTFNEGTDYSVRYSKLKSEFDKLKNDYNAHTHAYNPGPGAPAQTAVTGTQNTSDMSTAKVDDIKVPAP